MAYLRLRASVEHDTQQAHRSNPRWSKICCVCGYYGRRPDMDVTGLQKKCHVQLMLWYIAYYGWVAFAIASTRPEPRLRYIDQFA